MKAVLLQITNAHFTAGAVFTRHNPHDRDPRCSQVAPILYKHIPVGTLFSKAIRTASRKGWNWTATETTLHTP